MDKVLEQKIRDIIKDEMKKNFMAGVPKVDPHQHNGVDNLKLNPANLLGWPIFIVTDATVAPTDDAPDGTHRFQFDGTNLREWFRADRTWYEITSTATNPGGVDGDLQINDNGAFGTIEGLNLDKTGNTRGLHAIDIQGLRTATTQVASGVTSTAVGSKNTASGNTSTAVGYSNTTSIAGSVAIGTLNTAAGSGSTPAVAIGIGNSSSGENATAIGVGALASGNGTLGLGNGQATGTQSDAVGFATSSGDSSIAIGTLVGGNQGGAVASGTKSIAIGTGTGGGATNKCTASNDDAIAIGNNVNATGSFSCAIGDFISATATAAFAFGGSITNSTANSVEIGLDSGNINKLRILQNGNIGINGNSYQNGLGVVFLLDANTVPTTTPVGGGILYSTGGALHWLGSAGTDTTIAIA